MPETVPGITFDEEGICSYCRAYEEEKYLGKEALDEIVESARSENNKYDCIVGASGGRDSTYVLYVAKAIYNLKVLAVNYDNELRVEQATDNLVRACKKLDVDLLRVRSKRDIAEKIVRSEIRLNLPLGIKEILPVMCIACAYGYQSAVYRAAEKYKAPLIFWGESKAEATGDMEAKASRAAREAMGDGRGRSKFKRFFNINYYKVRYYHLLQKLEFPVPGNSIFSGVPTLKNKAIKEIRLFDYIEWDRRIIKETITKELDWVKPDDHVSTWRTDCELHPLLHYCFLNYLGCTKMCFGYTNMINSGKMTREEALLQEESFTPNFTEDVRDFLLNRIGLTQKEVAIIESYEKSNPAS